MFHLTFLNAGLLVLAVAAVLPLIIWLLAKKKPPQLVFSSIRFIRNSVKEQKSRTQLKNILLLIIRILIILLVVLAAARPSLRLPNAKPGKSHPPTAVAVILDTSYSMDYTQDGKSTLEYAKNAVNEINRKLTSEDMSVLITSDESWNRINSQLHQGKLPENLVASVKTTWLPMPLDKVLEYASAKLAQSQFSNREIYLLTDGQAQTLPKQVNVPVLLIPLPKIDTWNNISCQNAAPVMQLTDRRQTQSIRFDLINHGNSIRKDVLVSVYVNGITAAEKFVTLQPHQKLTETLPFQIMNSGWQSGYVEILDEKLTADNRCWFAFPFNLHPQTGVITRHSSLPIILQTALRVYSTPQGKVELIAPEQVNWQRLKDYDALVIYAAGEFTPRLREFLQTATQAHKGILICADANLPLSWKGYLQQSFGVQLTSFSHTLLPITYVNKYHPITSLLDPGQLSRTSLTDCWTAQMASASGILLSSGNSPLAVAGNEHLLWLFDPASDKNSFFLEAAFPVFAFRSLQYLSNSQFEPQQNTVGQNLVADEIMLPEGEKLELNGNSFAASEPGIYTLNWNSGSSQEIAIQPDFKESVFQPWELPSSANFQKLNAHWQDQLFLSRLGHDLWKYLMFAVLGLLVLEFILVKSEEWKPGAKTD